MIKTEALLFPLNNSGSIAAFTTLRGDVDAADAYSQFNVCDYTGDDMAHVAYCREQLCSHLGIDHRHLIIPRQTHTANVAIVDADFLTLDDAALATVLQDIDALVTSQKDVVIGVNTADCVPVVLRDSTTGIIAVAHAGWKGTVARIVSNTVKGMVSIGASVKHIEAAIGASICPACFEVGDEVVDKFAEAEFPIDRIMERDTATGKAHIDLREANRLTLIDAGLCATNIASAGRCTRCNPSTYFSARRLGINSGRTFTFIVSR